MSDQEFDVLDELYFVQSFDEVQEASGLEAEALRLVLQQLLKKGWIRCLRNAQAEVAHPVLNKPEEFRQYYYLATKAGLMAHNSR